MRKIKIKIAAGSERETDRLCWAVMENVHAAIAPHERVTSTAHRGRAGGRKATLTFEVESG
ncbi:MULTISPECIES: hypothetical protein [Actinomadura]|jgi:hypothetical protein|uniref:Uncharacterized protein n=1 Tax=Actinomadura citrea TaxID=46158 RepID=A0A7Y9G6G1_9ACTN|nr:hypothetical protein [Actinomadura citrea]NYE10803.1 hypothetical protein [Actinomadura citrea]GGT73863.1 hypothetical protein GCM10010177_34620 [Actinomadura citrea]